MDENLIPSKEQDKKEIGITDVTKSDPNNWNLCGGTMLIGCWFGACLLPLVEIGKRTKGG